MYFGGQSDNNPSFGEAKHYFEDFSLYDHYLYLVNHNQDAVDLGHTFRLNQMNAFRMQIAGKMVKVWVNDKQVFEMSFGKSMAGRLGLIIEDHKRIDNFRVQPIQ